MVFRVAEAINYADMTHCQYINIIVSNYIINCFTNHDQIILNSQQSIL